MPLLPHQNPTVRFDVNADGFVTPADALSIHQFPFHGRVLEVFRFRRSLTPLPITAMRWRLLHRPSGCSLISSTS